MHLWIDADACPGVVKDITIKAASKRRIKTTFVANQPMGITNDDLFTFILVKAGADVADQHIAEQAVTGDLVITQDIPLAAILLDKNIMVINPHGKVLDKRNIGDRLSTRNLMEDLRGAGQITGGPKPFSPKDKERFANSLDKWLTKLSQ